jgi:predicted Ser/Thr protein kinase
VSESPPSFPVCPRCSAPLAPTAAQGSLCPRCLLAQGLAHSDPEPPQAPPELSELAPLFPELEIVALLGQGGMGAVYKARQRALDRWVALKILTPRAGDEAGFAARFEREAHALARLSHPNVVGIHDSGRTQGRCWLLMEYVEGASLRQLLRTGELDVPRALAIVRQICDALEFAHERGIVHRDIKPENVLVDTRGRVKIADFGLAKIVGEAQPSEPITRTQQSMGTPQYMAPEQLTGSPNVDHRADIYSLGVVFYELLTGELPLGRFEPPSQRVQVDVRLDEVVLRALERAPERRYQHATEMKTGIENLDQPAQVPSPAVPVPDDPPWMFALLAVPVGAVLLGLAIGALGIEGVARQRVEDVGLGLAILFLIGLAWSFRKDRRGALLRYAAAAFTLAVSVACIVRAPEYVVLASQWLAIEPRPFDTWIARLLFALIAFEGLRFAWSARRRLRECLVEKSAWIIPDFVLVCGGALLGQQFLQNGSFNLLLAVLLVCWADWGASARQVSGPEPREWLRKRVEQRRGTEEPARAPRTRWVRGIILPVLVAVSAWVMSAYTGGWGWYSVLASSLVLALAVAGYLQQSIAAEVLEELRKESPALRTLRAASAVLVLSIGAMGIGAAALGVAPRAAAEFADPSGDRLLHLAQLVAASSHEPDDPLLELPARIQVGRLSWDSLDVAPPRPFDAHRPDALDAALLVLLAPALLVWTRRFQKSWGGCWRHSLEVLLIVLAGWAGSLPVRALLRLNGPGARKPLVLEASFPFSQQRASEHLRHVLELEGYSVLGSDSRVYSDPQGSVLYYGRLRAQGAPGPCPELECELAGDAGHWGAALRLDAGDVPQQARAEARERLTRILQETRTR